MKIFILKATRPQARILGYFTNFAILCRTLQKHARELGLHNVDRRAAEYALIRGDIRKLNSLMKTGAIECVPVNAVIEF